MIARIETAKSLAHAVKYNEDKVSLGVARFISSNGGMFFQSVEEKIRYLQDRADLNKRVKVQCTHIFLNFAPGDVTGLHWFDNLSRIYMERIGFGTQPYLVYEHWDAPHPHLHIVSTPIDEEGKRILLNDLIRYGSRKITLAMEREFDLMRTHGNKRPGSYNLDERYIEGNLLEEEAAPPIAFGRETMGPAMDRTLRKVLGHYRCTSLDELNALLRPYRLKADRGKPGSRTYEHGGLVYKVLDEHGKPQGNYIKASQLPGQPTLAYLQKRFEECRPGQEKAALQVRNLVDWALLNEDAPSLPRLQEDLQESGIQMIWGSDLVYVDHRTRWAFSASVLGKVYEAPAILNRCRAEREDLSYQEQMHALWPEMDLTAGLLSFAR